MNVLFVCSGNICRSAMAESALRADVRAAGLDGVGISSAGTLGIEGCPADALAILVAGEAGGDLAAHRSRGLTREAILGADLVAVMEREHLDDVRRLAPSHPGIRLLTEFLPADDPASGTEIDDPVCGTIEDFRECLRLIRRCLAGMTAALAPSRAGDPPRTEEEYFGRIAGAVAAARGGAAELTSMEFHVVDRWWQAGVPLWLALESIDAAAGLWQPGEAPRSFLRAVEQEMARRRAELPPEAPPVSPAAGGGGEGAIPRACARLVSRIDAAIGALHEDHAPLRRALAEARDRFEPPPGSMPALEQALALSRSAVAAAAAACAGEAATREAASEARAALRARGGPAAPAPPEEIVRRLAEARLLARFPIPAFALLDLLDDVV